MMMMKRKREEVGGKGWFIYMDGERVDAKRRGEDLAGVGLGRLSVAN